MSEAVEVRSVAKSDSNPKRREPGRASRGSGAADAAASSSERAASNRKAVTQGKILQASMRLFATRGYDRTSMTQIARRAGVSRASIFWHFSDKATLFGETCRHFLVPFRESLEGSGVDEDPRERILQQLQAYERFIEEQGGVIHSFVSWVFASQPHVASLRQELLALHGAFQASLERDLARIIDEPAEAAGFASMLVSLLHGNMLLSLSGAPPDTDASRSELVRALFERIAPKG